MLIISLTVATLVAVLLGAAVPPYLGSRRGRVDAARRAREAAEAEREARERAAAEERERRSSVEAAAVARAAAEERSTVQSDPVTAVASAAIEGTGLLLPAWAEVQVTERAVGRADLEVDRAWQAVATAEAAVPPRLDTPAWRGALSVVPWAVAAVVVIETVLNYRIFEPLVGATLAPLVAPLAAGVLGAAAFWAGAALRACAAEWAVGRRGSYGAWVLLLGGVAASVAAVVGMVWLAPSRSAGPHDELVAIEQGNVAQATLRFQEDPTAKRSLDEAQARLDAAERARDKAATTDRVIVLGSSVLEMGLIELVLLGAPIRERRRAQAAEEAAERERVDAIEERAAAKASHTQQLNPIVNQMIDYLVGHGLAIDPARAAVEQAFVHAGAVDGVGEIVRLTRTQYDEPELDHGDHVVVPGEVEDEAPAEDEAPLDGPMDDRAEALTGRHLSTLGFGRQVVLDPVDDQRVDLDASPTDSSEEDPEPAAPIRPSLDDYDMFA